MASDSRSYVAEFLDGPKKGEMMAFPELPPTTIVIPVQPPHLTFVEYDLDGPPPRPVEWPVFEYHLIQRRWSANAVHSKYASYERVLFDRMHGMSGGARKTLAAADYVKESMK